jgi:hypothetical protein
MHFILCISYDEFCATLLYAFQSMYLILCISFHLAFSNIVRTVSSILSIICKIHTDIVSYIHTVYNAINVMHTA